MDLTLSELAQLARKIRKENNLTQAQAAARLSGRREVAQSHISRAEHGETNYASLAIRIVEEIGGLEVEPIYRVHSPKSAPNTNSDNG